MLDVGPIAIVVGKPAGLLLEVPKSLVCLFRAIYISLIINSAILLTSATISVFWSYWPVKSSRDLLTAKKLSQLELARAASLLFSGIKEANWVIPFNHKRYTEESTEDLRIGRIFLRIAKILVALIDFLTNFLTNL